MTKLKKRFDTIYDKFNNKINLVEYIISIIKLINHCNVLQRMFVNIGSMNIEPLRVYAGLLMTSLNSAGVHITLLKLSGDDKSFFLGCLDAPTVAPKWPGCVYSISTENARKVVKDPVVRTVETIGMEITLELQNLLKQCLKSACESIIQKETHLNDLDRGCGDGDTGSTLNRLATGMYATSCLRINTKFPVLFNDDR